MSAQPMPITSIRLTIPLGILDLCDQAARRLKHGEAVWWYGGLRDILVKALDECGIPKEMTAVDAARYFGILKKRRRAC